MKLNRKIMIGALLGLAILMILSITAAADEGHTHDDITFTAWTETGSLPAEAGSYYLENDVTLSSQWSVPGGTTNLCLNGHTITGSGSARVIYIDMIEASKG